MSYFRYLSIFFIIYILLNFTCIKDMHMRKVYVANLVILKREAGCKVVVSYNCST